MWVKSLSDSRVNFEAYDNVLDIGCNEQKYYFVMKNKVNFFSKKDKIILEISDHEYGFKVAKFAKQPVFTVEI